MDPWDALWPTEYNLLETLLYLCLLLSVPVLIYKNADTLKKDVISDNRGKSGIYRWINNINGKCYVGSSIDLVSRLYCYYSLKFLYNDINKIKNLSFNLLAEEYVSNSYYVYGNT